MDLQPSEGKGEREERQSVDGKGEVKEASDV